jgi:hypothetical protein
MQSVQVDNSGAYTSASARDDGGAIVFSASASVWYIYILPVLIKGTRPKILDSHTMSELSGKRFKFKLPNLEGTYALCITYQRCSSQIRDRRQGRPWRKGREDRRRWRARAGISS